VARRGGEKRRLGGGGRWRRWRRRRATLSSFGLGERLDEVLELSNPHVFPPSTHAAAKVHIFTSISSIYTNTTAEQRTGSVASNCARVVELVAELDGIVRPNSGVKWQLSD